MAEPTTARQRAVAAVNELLCISSLTKDALDPEDVVAAMEQAGVSVVVDEELDEKDRGPTYWRGHADGRLRERAEVLDQMQELLRSLDSNAEVHRDDDSKSWVRLGRSQAATAAYLRALLTGDQPGVRAARRAVHVAACVYPGHQHPDSPPPFAPELADAPIRVGPSGAPAPMVVDEPVHDSTLPAELEDGEGR